MAESYQIKAFAKTCSCAPLNGIGSKLSSQLTKLRKNYPVRKRIFGLDFCADEVFAPYEIKHQGLNFLCPQQLAKPVSVKEMKHF